MQRIKMMLMAMIAVLAVGAVSASAASADGTITATISGTAGATVGPCDFIVDYEGIGTPSNDPPNAIRIDGGSFAGNGITQPCDPSSITSLSDIGVQFSGSGSNWTATLGGYPTFANTWSVSALVDIPWIGETECTFPVSSGSVTVSSTTGVNGQYNGSGGTNWSSCILPADLEVTGLVVDPS